MCWPGTSSSSRPFTRQMLQHWASSKVSRTVQLSICRRGSSNSVHGAGEGVYVRECVVTLQGRTAWLKEGRTVKLGQQPYKTVKARPKWDKMTGAKVMLLLLEKCSLCASSHLPPSFPSPSSLTDSDHCYQFLKRPYNFQKETQKRPFFFQNKRPKRDL